MIVTMVIPGHPDQNWFLDNDGDHHGGGQPIISCTRPAGNWFAPSELISVSDCDDNNRYINPGATEFCNGIDDNCDGMIDQPTVVLQAVSFM